MSIQDQTIGGIGLSKIAAALGVPIANYLVQFIDTEIPKPLDANLVTWVTAAVVAGLIWAIPHSGVSNIIGAIIGAKNIKPS